MRRWMTWLALACAVGAAGARAAASGGPLAMSRAWVIVPGEAIGPIRLGMSRDEVRAAVGEPERTSLGGWEYLSGGYAVLFSTPRQTVSAILGGDAGYPHGELAKAFVARTREGIGMGSTRAEVIAALGEPAVATGVGAGGEVLSYRGLVLMLVDGRVAHVTVRARPASR